MIYGKIIVITREGTDGADFKLRQLNSVYFLGRGADCDIIIKLPGASKKHCMIKIEENGEIYLTNLSTYNPVTVNSKYFKTVKLEHGDVFSVIDRSFRFESLLSKKEDPQVFEKVPHTCTTNKSKNLKKTKRSKEEVKARTKRRRKLKKLRYLENVCNKTPTSAEIQETETEQGSSSGVIGKRKDNQTTFLSDFKNDPLFSKMVTFQKTKRMAAYLRDKYTL